MGLELSAQLVDGECRGTAGLALAYKSTIFATRPKRRAVGFPPQQHIAWQVRVVCPSHEFVVLGSDDHRLCGIANEGIKCL